VFGKRMDLIVCWWDLYGSVFESGGAGEIVVYCVMFIVQTSRLVPRFSKVTSTSSMAICLTSRLQHYR